MHQQSFDTFEKNFKNFFTQFFFKTEPSFSVRFPFDPHAHLKYSFNPWTEGLEKGNNYKTSCYNLNPSAKLYVLPFPNAKFSFYLDGDGWTQGRCKLSGLYDGLTTKIFASDTCFHHPCRERAKAPRPDVWLSNNYLTEHLDLQFILQAQGRKFESLASLITR